MRYGDAGFIDFAVNQEGRNAGIFGFLHRANGGICTGVIKNDGFGFARDGGFNQLILLIHVIIMRGHQRGVTEGFGFLLRAVGFGLKERVIMRWRNNGQQPLIRRQRRRRDHHD